MNWIKKIWKERYTEETRKEIEYEKRMYSKLVILLDHRKLRPGMDCNFNCTARIFEKQYYMLPWVDFVKWYHCRSSTTFALTSKYHWIVVRREDIITYAIKIEEERIPKVNQLKENTIDASIGKEYDDS